MKEIVSSVEMQDILRSQIAHLKTVDDVVVIPEIEPSGANWKVAVTQNVPGQQEYLEVQNIALRLAAHKEVDWDAEERDLSPDAMTTIFASSQAGQLGVPVYRGTLAQAMGNTAKASAGITYTIQVERPGKTPRNLLLDEVVRLRKKLMSTN